MSNSGSLPCTDFTASNNDVIVIGYSQTLARADVTLTCVTGSQFTTGAQTVVMTCNFALAQWLNTVPQCLGNILHHVSIITNSIIINIISINFIAATTMCSEIPVLHNAVMSATSSDVSMVVTYSCLIGHHFPDGTDIRTIVCLTNDTWSGIIEDCAR